MSLITDVLVQDCIYWEQNGKDRYGKTLYKSPRSLRCRWTDYMQEIVSETGEKIISKSSIMVGEDLKIHGILMLGVLEDVVVGLDPLLHEGAGGIKQVSKIPDFTATEFIRKVYL